MAGEAWGPRPRGVACGCPVGWLVAGGASSRLVSGFGVDAAWRRSRQAAAPFGWRGLRGQWPIGRVRVAPVGAWRGPVASREPQRPVTVGPFVWRGQSVRFPVFFRGWEILFYVFPVGEKVLEEPRVW